MLLNSRPGVQGVRLPHRREALEQWPVVLTSKRMAFSTIGSALAACLHASQAFRQAPKSSVKLLYLSLFAISRSRNGDDRRCRDRVVLTGMIQGRLAWIRHHALRPEADGRRSRHHACWKASILASPNGPMEKGLGEMGKTVS